MENRRCGERCSNTSYIYHEERNHQGRDNRILFPLRLETGRKMGAVRCRERRGAC